MADSEPRLQFVDTSVVFPPIDHAACEIRLLHLLPSSTDDNILCDLSVASLNRCPDYEALSYVWGDKASLSTITVNKSAFKVTKNLYKALCNLIPTNGSPRVLWVDAICINQGNRQSDLEERSQQVSLMGRIFASAISVTAFLGDPFPGLELAMQYLALAADEPDRHIDTSHQHHLFVSEKHADSTQLELAKSMMTIFNRRWWRRMWTLQEYILAREVSFQFGKLRFSADMVTRGVLSLIHHKSSGCCDAKISEAILTVENGEDRDDREDGEKGDIVESFQRPQWQQYAQARNWSLTHGLAIFYDLECIDPRDKIYALLDVFPNSNITIKPDYEITPEQLFQDFSLAWADKERNLSFLGFVHSSSPKQLDVPTWAIDWTRRSRSSSRKHSWMQRHRSFFNRLYNTHLGTIPTWSRLSPGRVIANGFLFDMVIPGPALPDRAFTPQVSWTEQYEWLRSCLGVALEHSTAYESVSDAFLHNLCGDMLVIGEELNRAKHVWPGARTKQAAGADDEKLFSQWWEETFRPSRDISRPLSPDTKKVELAVRVATTDRSFITTTKGFIGLAPDACLPGDVVAILGGSAVPVILRPAQASPRHNGSFDLDGVSGSSFQVIGDAYIHGVMDGEAFSLCGRTENLLDDLILI